MLRRDSQLTARQRAILAVSAAGLTNAEVAERLNLPLDCVRGEIASAIRSLGAHSKLEAVVIALRTGQMGLEVVDSEREDRCLPVLVDG